MSVRQIVPIKAIARRNRVPGPTPRDPAAGDNIDITPNVGIIGFGLISPAVPFVAGDQSPTPVAFRFLSNLWSVLGDVAATATRHEDDLLAIYPNLANLNDQVITLIQRVIEVETDVARQETDIANLDAAVANLGTAITDLEVVVNDNTAAITNLNNSLIATIDRVIVIEDRLAAAGIP